MNTPVPPIPITWQLWVIAALSGVSASVFTMFSTYSIEKFGGIVGGVLGTIPAAIIPASIGLSIIDTDDEFDFISTLYCVPPGIAMNALLLLLWRFLPPRLHNISLRKRVALMVGISLFVWGAVATGVGFLIQHMLTIKISIKIIGGVAIGITAVVWLLVTLCGRTISGRGEGRMRFVFYLIAALVAGLFAAAALVLAAFNDVASGLSISFPAVLLTTLASLSLRWTDSLSVGASTSMLGGSISVSLYAITLAEMVPVMETAFGQKAQWWISVISALISWVICVVGVSLPVAWVLQWRAKKSQSELGRLILANVPDAEGGVFDTDERTPLAYDDPSASINGDRDSIATGGRVAITTDSLLRKFEDDDSNDYH